MNNHVGVCIMAELTCKGWIQADLALVLGCDKSVVSRLVNGHQRITPRMAIALGDAFGVDPLKWLTYQSYYDLYKEKIT